MRRLAFSFSVAHHLPYSHVPWSSFRSLSTVELNRYNNVKTPPEPREVMDFDVLIVGAGPAGLSAAIRLKQLEKTSGKSLSVCVIEKAGEIGAHILSGNVFEPRGLKELFPEFEVDPSFQPLGENPTKVTRDQFLFLFSHNSSIKIPNFFLPSTLHNDGNYVISLSKLVRFLGKKAEELGVEVYPGFPAAEVIIEDNTVKGVITKDMGITKTKSLKSELFTPGVELRAKTTIFAEGARGNCTEQVTSHFNLRENCFQQSYGLGLKEVWEIDTKTNKLFSPGFVQHTVGYPLDNSTYGGSFLYHMKPNYLLLGQVVGLDYKNPYLNLFNEFQRLKRHKEIQKYLIGGKCVGYGARVINEGGVQSIPKLSFPGGKLIGCSAGFLNVPKIKGSHLAIKSGIVCAESIVNNTDYESDIKKSWVWEELNSVRNYAPSFKYGLYSGLIYSGLSGFILKGKEPWTLNKSESKTATDADKTESVTKHKPISYPKPDNVYTFDILTSLSLSGTNHNENQLTHLTPKPDSEKDIKLSMEKFDGIEEKFCPAKVYEYVEVEDESGNDKDKNKSQKKKLVINGQNCVHCKCCSIKATKQFIQWNVPEGGGGPQYELM